MKMFLKSKRLILLVALLLIFTVSTQNTLTYIITGTPSLINTFVPFRSLLSDLIIEKSVEHPLGDEYEYPDNVQFQFQVDLGAFYAGVTYEVYVEGETELKKVTTDENGCFTVTAKPGSYVGIKNLDEGLVVKVTEIQVDDDGFTVKGDEVTQEVRMLGATETYAQFINIYSPKPVEPVTVNVSGVKILEGREWAEGDTFQFVLEQEQGDDNWVKIADRTITYDAANTGFNSFTFSDLIQSMTFDKVGIYAFRMTEAEGTLENVTYDKTVNYFSIHVTDVDMDGKLEIGKVTGKQNCAITQDATTGVYDVLVTFNNTFIPPVIPDPDPITVSLFVQKTVKNTTSKTIGPEGFNFLVEQTGSTQPWTITSDADGKAQLDLTYTHEDLGKTYTYTVSEINDGREGVLYSEQTYELTVTITLDEENNILVPKLTNGGESVNKWETAFENTYTHKEPLTPPTGDETPLLMWSILMAASGIAIVVLVVTGRKKKWS